jgi:hypothetical protein
MHVVSNEDAMMHSEPFEFAENRILCISAVHSPYVKKISLFQAVEAHRVVRG